MSHGLYTVTVSKKQVTMTASFTYEICTTKNGNSRSVERSYAECKSVFHYLTETNLNEYINCAFPIEANTDVVRNFELELQKWFNYVCKHYFC